MTPEHFRVDLVETVATVTFDRPPVNAQNQAVREELVWLFDDLSDRDDVRVVILTAAGRTFSAGADIKERSDMGAGRGGYRRNNRLAREFFYAVTDCEKPVIAAVNGPALGAGFVLALACDILVASENAYFVMPELDMGMAGGGRFLMQHFGRSAARAIYFTGRRVGADELYRKGIVEACVPPDRLMDTALEIARQIAAKSPLAVRQVKRAFNTIEEMPVRDGYRFEQSITADLARTEDTREAQRAFLEKRDPVFKGR